MVCCAEELGGTLDAHRPVGGCKLNLVTKDYEPPSSILQGKLLPTALVTRLRTTWSTRCMSTFKYASGCTAWLVARAGYPLLQTAHSVSYEDRFLM
jgi:hypothetical protein